MIRAASIIPAAGLGVRFQDSCPGLPSKLNLSLGGKRLIERALEPFLEHPAISEVIVAVPPGKTAEFKRAMGFRTKKRVVWVTGGKTRTESVERALRKVSASIGWVLVHDGARPLLDKATLDGFLRELARKGSLILARPVHPTIKAVESRRVQRTVPREGLWEAETPQGFKKQLLLRAYENLKKHPFQATDEASLVEAIGEVVHVLKGERPNLKITEYTDYEMAEGLLSGKANMRIGSGFDIHRLVPGRKLWLGGVCIPNPVGTLGHSDGDPVLHALSDAMLGALGLGDIGEHFPDDSKKTRGMASARILEDVYAKVRANGFQLVNADINLILERPKLKDWKMKMRRRIAEILSVPIEQIGLKARTAEGLGAIGSGEAVAAQAVVLFVAN